MKISPVSSTGTVVGNIEMGNEAPKTMSQRIRSLKMNTNATPGAVAEAPVDPTLTIPDVDSDKTKEATEENQPLSPQFAALARERRALQVRERAVADKEKALEAQSTSTVAGIDRAKFKADPLGVMLEEGIDYAQLTEAVLARQDGYNPKIAALEAKIAALESGIDKKLTDRDEQSVQAALVEMRKEAVLLSAQGEAYQLVRDTGSIPQVMKLIERTYREKGDVLDVSEALNLVEEDLKQQGLTLAKSEKVRSQLIPETAVPQPPQQQRQMRTLTNRDTASVPLGKKERALAAWARNNALKK